MALDKIHVATSSLTGNINIVRIGKDPRTALETKNATNQVLGAVVEHVMADAPKGATITITRTDGAAFELTVVPKAGA